MILLGFLAIAFLAVFCSWYTDSYRVHKSECVSKISFRKFLDIYETSESKISLKEEYFKYYPDAIGFCGGYSFYFSIPDTIRYELWRMAKVRREQKEKNKRRMDDIEKCWEKDKERYGN